MVFLLTVEESRTFGKEDSSDDKADHTEDLSNVAVDDGFICNEPELQRNVHHSDSKNIEDPESSVTLKSRREELDRIHIRNIVSSCLRNSAHKDDEVKDVQIGDEVCCCYYREENHQTDKKQGFASIDVRCSWEYE